MANVDAPFGLRPIRHFNGSPWNGAYKTFLVEDDYATAFFIGDPCVITGVAPSDDPSGHYTPIEHISGSTATEEITGVVVGIEPVLTDLSKNYLPASTGGLVHVCVDTDMVYAIQDDGSAVLTGTSIGDNTQIVSGTGSTVTGLSGWELEADETAAGDVTYNCLILGVHNVEGNAFGINCIWEVLLNTIYNHDNVLGT